ncbi:hypothetical protein [Candidatus Mycoplasma haematominutum]|uniref:Lipoprotein n=1 Tax=Candidatus Mycoplasma haematominutum 'Birmingham 1' TaxID=1116213 RepID=G8C3R6_9MOLU|nr:hypothetical protein [Candidatus Mycoplasma haematominutum]CCE66964.1 hypothetical protein MHM_04460 [Candidatus Mycoplasma haematominutum 'Birmingham 1']
MSGIFKLTLCLGGGVALTSCAAAAPFLVNATKSSTVQTISSEDKKENLRRNWKNVEVKWRPICGVSHPSLCLFSSIGKR